MNNSLLNSCPSCLVNCSVNIDQVGTNVICPNCTQEFTAYQTNQCPENSGDYAQLKPKAKDQGFKAQLEDKGSAEVGDTGIGGNFKNWIEWLGGLFTIAVLIYNINLEFLSRTEYGQKKWIEEIVEEQEKKDHPEIKRINVKVNRFDQNDGGDIKTGYATLSGDGETVDIVFKSNLSHEKDGKHSMEVMWHPAIGGRPYGDQIYNSESEKNK